MFKKAYYYLFYKYFKFAKWSPSIFPSDWVATICMVTVELWILFAFLTYWDFLIGNSKYSFFSLRFLIPFIGILVLKWFAFEKDKGWKKYIKEFDRIPKSKNITGSVGVALFTLLALINFCISVGIAHKIPDN